MRLRLVALPVLAAALVACSPARAETPAARPLRTTESRVQSAPMVAPETETAHGAALVTWWNGLQFVQAVQQASSVAAVEPQVSGAEVARGPQNAGTDSSGDSCYGGRVPDGIVDRESHGDPTVTYGGGHAASPLESGGLAWGCFQEMPQHYEPGGACADITDYSITGQKECADRLPDSAWSL